jgi:acyl-CoA thioester hydrolase
MGNGQRNFQLLRNIINNGKTNNKSNRSNVQQQKSIGLVVETHCNYFSSVSFPDLVTAGLCVTQLGKSSVRYEVGIFRGEDHIASAQGHFVHVYVDRITRKPTPIPPKARALLESLHVVNP